jgi:flagellin
MAVGDANRINSNLASLSALNALADVNRRLATSRLRLSTGKRINEASDDPAGYSIAHTLTRGARGLGVALSGVQTAQNLLGVAEGALENINQILLSMRDLVVQGASDTLGTKSPSGNSGIPAERMAINTQLTALRAEIDRIACQTTFNGMGLLDGSFMGNSTGHHPVSRGFSQASDPRFQTGDTAGDYISFAISSNFNSASIGLANVNVWTPDRAAQSLPSVDAAITIVTSQIQAIGSTVERLRLAESHLSVAMANTTAAKSRILDADVAQEQATATRLSILQRVATAQLAQANVSPAGVLYLFR